MSKLSMRLDLLKLQGAFVMNITGKSAKKQCLVIPIEDADLFVGEKGIYLNLVASEMDNPKFNDTHCIRQSISEEKYKAMTDEERQQIPILGGARPMESKAPQSIADATDYNASTEDDFPF